MQIDPERAKLVDKDFQHVQPNFNLDPDRPLNGERLLLDPSNPIPDPTHEVITDDTGTRTVPISEERRREIAVKSMLKHAHDADQLTLEDLLPQRIKVAHRVVREMGRLRGLIQPNETIEFALRAREHNVDPWQIPEKYNRPRDMRRSYPEVVEAMIAAEELPAMYWYGKFNNQNGQWQQYPGVALLPPPIPKAWLDETGEVFPGYTPEDDKLLMAYMDVFSKTSDRLCIDQGSRDEPYLGQYAMSGLSNLDLVRIAFPTKLQIVTWEVLLIEETLDLLVDKSDRATRKNLYYKYGLMEHEIDQLIKLAQQRAMEQHCGDQDTNRAIVILKIQDYIRRCRESLNVKAEMNGLKQLSLVMGLTNEQQDSLVGDFVALMTKVNAERQAELQSGGRKIVENTADRQALPAGVLPPASQMNGASHARTA